MKRVSKGMRFFMQNNIENILKKILFYIVNLLIILIFIKKKGNQKKSKMEAKVVNILEATYQKSKTSFSVTNGIQEANYVGVNIKVILDDERTKWINITRSNNSSTDHYICISFYRSYTCFSSNMYNSFVKLYNDEKFNGRINRIQKELEKSGLEYQVFING